MAGISGEKKLSPHENQGGRKKKRAVGEKKLSWREERMGINGDEFAQGGRPYTGAGGDG